MAGRTQLWLFLLQQYFLAKTRAAKFDRQLSRSMFHPSETHIHMTTASEVGVSRLIALTTAPLRVLRRANSKLGRFKSHMEPVVRDLRSAINHCLLVYPNY